jgi:hypothetical protein
MLLWDNSNAEPSKNLEANVTWDHLKKQENKNKSC